MAAGSKSFIDPYRQRCYNTIMDDTNNNYHDVLLEQLRDQNKAILEYVGEMPKVVVRLTKIEQDVTELKQDIKVIKAAVTDLSHQVADDEHRISRLEAA